ncbi:putative phosphothreonine lyase domain-containing protein [Tenacibaculum sp. M341]|uniref:putative phosphothreonine lyase domain-containing protein n=1 Tax=Tenacibaculum sp. M341 TaxID=2530339 RepID=UPI001050527C|nr:putative phosphothreonine lyase domain-containg protein [Tenacibaculum sp. M341]TCI90574.1 DUF1917 domain-containing protein [Tenacibaculum sp. M341]
MSPDQKSPSKVNDDYWIYAFNEKDNYTLKRGNSGKWMIFEHISGIDAVWFTIRESVINGQLGNSAKVSTAKTNKNALDPDYKVICIYTANFDNKEDVERIEKNIRALGINHKLIYKLDKDIGKYESKGYKNLAATFSYSEAYFNVLKKLKENSFNKHVSLIEKDHHGKPLFKFIKLNLNDTELNIEKRKLIRLGFQIKHQEKLNNNCFYFSE